MNSAPAVRWARPRGRSSSASSSRTIPHAAIASTAPEPQPLHDPHRQAEPVAEREPRRHRERVAAVLAGPHVAEVGGRRPCRQDVGQEASRIDVQAELGVGDRLARRLGECDHEREAGEGKRGRSATHAGGEGTLARRCARNIQRCRKLLLAALIAGPTVLAFFSGGFFDQPRLVALIAAWLLLALAVVAGAPPLPQSRWGIVALGGLAAYTAWIALSASWSPLPADAHDDAQRALVYLGALAAAIALLRQRAWARTAELGLTAGAVLVVALRAHRAAAARARAPGDVGRGRRAPEPAADVLERDGRARRDRVHAVRADRRRPGAARRAARRARGRPRCRCSSSST